MSTYCLELMAKEVFKFEDWDFDVDRCDCVLMSTHGIPCACSISMSMDEDRGVYLEEIDHFWRTLVIGDGVDMLTFMEEAEQDSQFLRELVDEVQASDPAVRRAISRLIHSQLHPHLDPDNPIEEPETNVNTRGAPRGSRSTKRIPSSWEFRGRRSSRSRSRGTGTNDFPHSFTLF